jgi:hypothetical protein
LLNRLVGSYCRRHHRGSRFDSRASSPLGQVEYGQRPPLTRAKQEAVVIAQAHRRLDAALQLLPGTNDDPGRGILPIRRSRYDEADSDPFSLLVLL